MPDINGIPYVESTDLVSGWPTVSQSVAQEVSDQLASKLDLAGGKILQIVRATDSTSRATTSSTYVDVTGMSVTITPQKSDSAVLIMALGLVTPSTGSAATSGALGYLRITDSSDNAISGAEELQVGFSLAALAVGNGSILRIPFSLSARATPATTSAVTYKLRFRADAGFVTTTTIANNVTTGQMYAIEVSA